MTKTLSEATIDLQDIPGVGPKLAEDLRALGCYHAEDLLGKDPEDLFLDLCRLRGRRIDRCVLYVFRCAVYWASHDVHDPSLLKWWNWKDS